MTKKAKIRSPKYVSHLIMVFVVLGIGIIGSIFVVISHAATPYSNPYSCSSHPTLSTSTRTSQATCTKYVQYILHITVDGDYYTATKSAVQNFQFSNRIANSGCGSSASTCDGIVGSATWTKLDQSNASQTQAAAPAPTGSLVCASSTTSSSVITIKYANASSSQPVDFFRSGSHLSSYTNGSATVSYTSSGLAAGTNYVYQLRHNSSVYASINCATAAPNPTGTVTCGSSTTSSITLNVSYANASSAKPVALVSGSAGLATYTNGSTSTTFNSTGLAAGSAHNYQLKYGSTVLSSINCNAAAAPAPPAPDPTPDPTPDPGTTDPGTSDPSGSSSGISYDSGSSSGGSTDGIAGLDTGSSDSSSGSSADTSGSSSDSSYTDGSGSDASSSGDNLTNEQIAAADQNGDGVVTEADVAAAKTPAAKAKVARALKAQQTKAVKKRTAVIGSTVLLVIVGAAAFLIMRRRHHHAIDAYDTDPASFFTSTQLPQQPMMGPPVAYGQQQPYAVPVQQMGPMPLPQTMPPQMILQPRPVLAPQPLMTVSNAAVVHPAAPIKAPVPTNTLDKIITNTFYPGQLQSLPQEVVTNNNQPQDMFDAAREHPESFGNTHYSLGSNPAPLTAAPSQPAPTIQPLHAGPELTMTAPPVSTQNVVIRPDVPPVAVIPPAPSPALAPIQPQADPQALIIHHDTPQSAGAIISPTKPPTPPVA
jgi:hypothetical protein